MDGMINEYGVLIISRKRKGKDEMIKMNCQFAGSYDGSLIHTCGDSCPHFDGPIHVSDGFIVKLCHGKELKFTSIDDKRTEANK